MVATALFVASVIPLPSMSATGTAGSIGLRSWTAPFHLVGYAALAALSVHAIARTMRGVPDDTRSQRGPSEKLHFDRWWTGPTAAVLLATGYGFGIEVIQWSLPWRSFAWLDVGLNAVGAAIGVGMNALVRWFRA